MYRLMWDHLEVFVIILDSKLSAIYQSVKFFKSEAYGYTFLIDIFIYGFDVSGHLVIVLCPGHTKWHQSVW